MGFQRGDQGQPTHSLLRITSGTRPRCSGGGSHEGPCPSGASFLDVADYPSGASRERPLCAVHAQRCADRWQIQLPTPEPSFVGGGT